MLLAFTAEARSNAASNSSGRMVSELLQFNFHLGRQPIYDRALTVVAWELLYRPSADATAAGEFDSDFMSRQVMVDAFLEMGIERIVGEASAFLNVGEEFFLTDNLPPLPPEKVVLELLETAKPTAALLAGVRQAVEAGYPLALDDFVYSEAWEPFVDLADIIKLDLLALGEEGLEREVGILREKEFSGLILGEKVETHEQMAFCRKLGLDLFQGYFLCRPEVVSGTRLPADRLAVLRLLVTLQSADSTTDQLEGILGTDPTLSYKLIRIINSALYVMPAQVESLRQTIVLLGRERLKAWATLLALGKLDDKPSQLRLLGLQRARLCELLAHADGRPHPESYFTVGLFSVLDAVFDLPMPELLAKIALAGELQDALLFQRGILGEALLCAKAHERDAGPGPKFGGLDEAAIRGCWLDSLDWSRKASREFGI